MPDKVGPRQMRRLIKDPIIGTNSRTPATDDYLKPALRKNTLKKHLSRIAPFT